MAVKVIHDRNGCIGCGACVAVCPDCWEMGDDGKSNLKGAKRGAEGEELMCDDKKKECNMSAAQACPVNVIHIINDKGKKEI